jgi:hypothetical protein
MNKIKLHDQLSNQLSNQIYVLNFNQFCGEELWNQSWEDFYWKMRETQQKLIWKLQHEQSNMDSFEQSLALLRL